MFEHPRLRAVICNSTMVREEIERRFGVAPEKLHVIYNGVDLEHFHPRHRAALRAAARAELGVGDGGYPVPVRRLRLRRKGLDAAIGALAALRRRGASAWRSPDATGDAARFAAQARAAGLGRPGAAAGRARGRAPALRGGGLLYPADTLRPVPEHRAGGAGDGPAGDRRAAQRRRRNRAARRKRLDLRARRRRRAGAADARGGAASRANRALPMRARARTAESYGIDDMARKLTGLYAALTQRRPGDREQ